MTYDDKFVYILARYYTKKAVDPYNHQRPHNHLARMPSVSFERYWASLSEEQISVITIFTIKRMSKTVHSIQECTHRLNLIFTPSVFLTTCVNSQFDNVNVNTYCQ